MSIFREFEDIIDEIIEEVQQEEIIEELILLKSEEIIWFSNKSFNEIINDVKHNLNPKGKRLLKKYVNLYKKYKLEKN